MSWIFNNPIGTMSGLFFIFFYAVYSAAVGWIALKSLRGIRAGKFVPMPFPASPDPYKMAWLRGGQPAVAELVLFRLLQTGSVCIDENERVTDKKAMDSPEVRALSDMERSVFDQLKEHEFLWDGNGLGNYEIEQFCKKYEWNARQAGLLVDPLRVEKITRRAVAAIVAMGLYKLLAALFYGDENTVFILFLLLMTGVSLRLFGLPGTLIPLFIAHKAGKLRLSRKGEDFLHRMTLGIGSFGKTGQGHDMLLGGLVGVIALSKLYFPDYIQVFKSNMQRQSELDLINTLVEGSTVRRRRRGLGHVETAVSPLESDAGCE